MLKDVEGSNPAPATDTASLDQISRLQLLLRAGFDLSSTLDLDDLLHQVVQICQKVMDCEGASILLLDRRTQELYFSKISNEEAFPSLRQIRLRLGEGVAGNVAATGIPEIVNQTAEDEHFSSKADEKSGIQTQNVLAVPMRTKTATIGVLEAINSRSGHFSVDDIAPGTMLASTAAVAIENAQLRAELNAEMSANLALVESKTRLITLLSNELRTPLATIRGAADLLGKGDKPAMMVQEMSRMIAAGANHMARTLEDLFLINELDKETGTPMVSPVDLAAVCKDQINQMQRDYSNHSFAFQSEGLAPFMVPGDRSRLAHVLLHVLDNAVKSAPEKGNIDVRLWGGEHQVSVTITDGGIGVAAGHEERIFDRYYQVEGKDDTSFDGLGLGLYISRSVVSMYGGTISLDPSRKEGSGFIITLPRSRR